MSSLSEAPRQHSGRHGRPRGRALKCMPLARKAWTCVLAAIRATLGPWGSQAPSAACCAGRTREVGAAVPWMTPLKAATGVFGKRHVLFAMTFFFLDTLSPPHPDTESSAFPESRRSGREAECRQTAERSWPGLRSHLGPPAQQPLPHALHTPGASLLCNHSAHSLPAHWRFGPKATCAPRNEPESTFRSYTVTTASLIQQSFL